MRFWTRKAARRITCLPVFIRARLPSRANSSTRRPISSIAPRFGPCLWMQATRGRNRSGNPLTRATNCPSAPPMANWFTNCKTGTRSFTTRPSLVRSCGLDGDGGSGLHGSALRHRDGRRFPYCPMVAARRESAQGVQEPRERISGELLTDEVPHEGREDGPRLVGHLAVARAEGRPERAEDEPGHAEQSDETQLSQHLELEVVGDEAIRARVDRRVLPPGREEGLFAHPQDRALLEDALRHLPCLEAVLDGHVLLVGSDGLVALPERAGREEEHAGRRDE